MVTSGPSWIHYLEATSKPLHDRCTHHRQENHVIAHAIKNCTNFLLPSHTWVTSHFCLCNCRKMTWCNIELLLLFNPDDQIFMIFGIYNLESHYSNHKSTKISCQDILWVRVFWASRPFQKRFKPFQERFQFIPLCTPPSQLPCRMSWQVQALLRKRQRTEG